MHFFKVMLLPGCMRFPLYGSPSRQWNISFSTTPGHMKGNQSAASNSVIPLYLLKSQKDNKMHLQQCMASYNVQANSRKRVWDTPGIPQTGNEVTGSDVRSSSQCVLSFLHHQKLRQLNPLIAIYALLYANDYS